MFSNWQFYHNAELLFLYFFYISWMKSKSMILNCSFVENLDCKDVQIYLLLKVLGQLKAYWRANLQNINMELVEVSVGIPQLGLKESARTCNRILTERGHWEFSTSPYSNAEFIVLF